MRILKSLPRRDKKCYGIWLYKKYWLIFTLPFTVCFIHCILLHAILKLTLHQIVQSKSDFEYFCVSRSALTRVRASTCSCVSRMSWFMYSSKRFTSESKSVLFKSVQIAACPRIDASISNTLASMLGLTPANEVPTLVSVSVLIKRAASCRCRSRR